VKTSDKASAAAAADVRSAEGEGEAVAVAAAAADDDADGDEPSTTSGRIATAASAASATKALMSSLASTSPPLSYTKARSVSCRSTAAAESDSRVATKRPRSRVERIRRRATASAVRSHKRRSFSVHCASSWAIWIRRRRLAMFQSLVA